MAATSHGVDTGAVHVVRFDIKCQGQGLERNISHL